MDEHRWNGVGDKNLIGTMAWIRSACERGSSNWTDGGRHKQPGTGQSSNLLGESLEVANKYF